jgi:ABC-type antimicrobial peptide transport system permease subunit
VFGILGTALALGAIGILNIIGIPAGNTFLTILFAGPVLRPVASPFSVFSSLFIVTVVGLIAHVYPVGVALKIQPVQAIQTE